MSNGKADSLYSKWFLGPILPNNITIDFEMPARLKELFVQPSDKASS